MHNRRGCEDGDDKNGPKNDVPSQFHVASISGFRVVSEDETNIPRALGRIEGTLDGMKTLLEKHLTDDTKRFDDHAKRIKAIEIGRARQAGATGVIALAVSALWGWFSK